MARALLLAWACTLVLPVAVFPAQPGSTATMDSQPTMKPANVSKKLMHRIIAGEYARPGEFPHQAVLNPSPDENQVKCGGSLVHPQWVLTAAHCFNDMRSVFVWLGVTDVRARQRSPYGQWADRILIHPGWNRVTFAHDIALVRLSQPAQLNQLIQPISLPTPAEAAQRVGLQGFVTGWGQVGDNSEFDPRLKVARFTSTDPRVCQQVFRDVSTDYHHQLCFPGYGRGGGSGVPCFGDSGGSFVSGGKVHGVVSYGPRPCSGGRPSIFTHVGSYLQWIYSTMNVQPFG